MSFSRIASRPWSRALAAAGLLALAACTSKPSTSPSGPQAPTTPSAGSAPAGSAPGGAPPAVAPPSAAPAAPAAPAVPAGPPGAPGRLTREPSSPGSLTLSWSPGPGGPAARFEVRRGDGVVATTAEPRVTLDGVPPEREVCHTVVAVGAAGERSAPSDPLCVTLSDATPPTVPADLKARLTSPTEAALTWRPSTDDGGLAGYEVQRDGKVVATVQATSASEGRLRAGVRACWTVRALDKAGNRSAPSEQACLLPPDVTPPTAPTTVTATPGPGQVALSWSGATDDVGVVSYEVLRDEHVIARAPGATAAAQEKGLQAAVTYCYQVRALDAAGQRSPLSAPACATPPDVTPPRPPATVTAKALNETEIALTWAAATDDVGVTGYALMRDGKAELETAATTATIGGFKAATRACWTVVARDAAGNRSAPSVQACATTLDLTPPSTPGEVVATVLGEHEASLRWAASTDNVGVVRYEVRRNGQVAGGSEPTVTTLAFKGLASVQRHCFTVVALDKAGNASPPSAPACVTTPDLTPPTVPANVAAAPSSATQLVLAWEPSKDEVGVAGYEVRRGESLVAKVVRPTAAEPGLAPSTEYCYTVRAFDAAGNLSAYSEPRCGTTAAPGTLPGPWDLQSQSTSANELDLAWAPSPQAGVTYVVYWESRGTDARVGTTPRASFKVFGQPAKERHCYRVEAESGGRTSPRSFPLCTSAGGPR